MQQNNQKIGVIDVGGGLRGIYATGVLDFCMQHDIRFDYGIGISAGAANLASYLAGQQGRNYSFYHDYSQRKEYMSAGEFVKHGSFLNLDYVYGTLSNIGGENPLDYEAMVANPMEWYMIATEVESGRPHYFTRDDISQDDYSVLKASCAIPAVCKPQVVAGKQYFDGALGNPVPVAKAFEDGCDKVVLILTKPADFKRKPGNDRKLAKLIRGKYPRAALALELRAQHYNEGVSLARTYAKERRLLIVAPADTQGMKTLSRDQEALQRFYEMGLADAEAIPPFLAAEL